MERHLRVQPPHVLTKRRQREIAAPSVRNVGIRGLLEAAVVQHVPRLARAADVLEPDVVEVEDGLAAAVQPEAHFANLPPIGLAFGAVQDGGQSGGLAQTHRRPAVDEGPKLETRGVRRPLVRSDCALCEPDLQPARIMLLTVDVERDGVESRGAIDWERHPATVSARPFGMLESQALAPLRSGPVRDRHLRRPLLAAHREGRLLLEIGNKLQSRLLSIRGRGQEPNARQNTHPLQSHDRSPSGGNGSHISNGSTVQWPNVQSSTTS